MTLDGAVDDYWKRAVRRDDGSEAFAVFDAVLDDLEAGAEGAEGAEGLGSAIKEEEIGEAAELRREKDQRDEDEVQGEELDGNIVGHIEREHVAHIEERDEGAEGRGAGDKEENAAD